MGQKDRTLYKQVKQKHTRLLQEEMRKEKELERIDDAKPVQMPASSEESEHRQEEYKVDPSPSRKHRRIMKTPQIITLTHDILSHPEVAGTIMRNNITPTVALATVEAICKAAGGDPTKLTLSYSSSYRFRLKAAKEMSEKIKQNWAPPRISVLHWDEKLMSTLDNQYIQEERMPVLISGNGHTKLLGVPKLPTHSTDKQGPL